MSGGKISGGLLRWVGLFVSGASLLSTGTCEVRVPGLQVSAEGDGVHVSFPGGVIDVADEHVLVDVSGVSIDVDHPCGHW